jgi:hypothetical protein
MAREPISPETTRRFLAAMDDVAGMVDDGLHPDAAIEKVARASDFPPGFVPLMVNAYNIAGHGYYRSSGSGPAEKAADFDVARLDRILRRLYPEEVKAAAAIERTEGVHPDYSRPPSWYRERRHRQAMEKAAGEYRDALGNPIQPPGHVQAYLENAQVPAHERAFLLNTEHSPTGPGTPPPAGAPSLLGQAGEFVAAHPVGTGLGLAATVAGAYGLRRLLAGKDDREAKHAEHPENEAWRMRRAKIACDDRQRRIERVRGLVHSAQDRLVSTLEKLAGYFQTHDALQIADIRENVRIKFGAAGTAILTHVGTQHPSLVKRAASRHRAGHSTRTYAEPYALVGRAIAEAEDILATRTLHTDLATACKQADAAAMADFRPTPCSILDRMDAEAEKVAFLGIGSIADKVVGTGVYHGVTDAARAVAPPDSDAVAEKALRRIATPEHEQQLRAIEAQAMLHEMLNNDEVLSGHDPYEVARHYNRISQFTPSLSTQPLVTIPAVRKSVGQGQLDSFDAKELVDTQHKYRESRKEAPR